MAYLLGFLDNLSPTTLIFLGVLAVLLFGERLPEVARSLGKKFTDFRRNVQDMQEEIRSAAFSATSEITSAIEGGASAGPSSSGGGSGGSAGRGRSRHSGEDYEEATAPKFVPPPSEPTA